MVVKRKFSGVTVSTIIALLLMVSSALAVPIDITSDTLTHFASFANMSPAGALSGISNSVDGSSDIYEFGWHNNQLSYANGPHYAGILLTAMYSVTGLRFQVHQNPFRNFILQGSTNTTGGLDGDWTDIFLGEVTNKIEYAWQEWSFSNNSSYSAYRIQIIDDYTGCGWAMYRWDLLAEPNTSPVPEPSTLFLLSLGLVGLVGVRKKFKK